MRVLSSPTKNRFELIEYSVEESKEATKNGWRWDGRKFCFFTASPEIASQYTESADPPVVRAIWKHQMTVMFSKATNCDGLEFPRPSGLEYLPFQKVGINYALQRPRTLIADEPGLGTTIQAIGVMNSDLSIRYVLVVCPAILKTNWVREINNWYLRLESIDIAYSPTQAPFPNTQIVVTNYDILRKIKGSMDARIWDLLILDECHGLKDSTAKRTIAVFGTKEEPGIKAKKTLLLSGTSLVNRPEDLWTVIKNCDPDDLGATWDYYGKRYCQLWRAPWGWDSSGAAHLDELQNRLRGRFMVRRLKKDVLQDLPSKRRQIIVVQPKEDIRDLIRREKDAFERTRSKLELTIEAAQDAIDAARQKGDWEGYRKEAKALSGVPNQEFAELSKLCFCFGGHTCGRIGTRIWLLPSSKIRRTSIGAGCDGTLPLACLGYRANWLCQSPSMGC
jgi:hypothetical protein